MDSCNKQPVPSKLWPALQLGIMKEDRESRQKLWPKIKKAREGKTAYLLEVEVLLMVDEKCFCCNPHQK